MTAPGEPIDISVVIPTLNEAENAAAIAVAAANALRGAGVTYEIIFIDNGSTDRTVEIVKDLCAADPRIRLIVNTRNFGQMRSPTHGIYQASGAAVIGLCADFQDPPEMIGQFIERWRRGAKIVLGVRASENTSPVLTAVREAGYTFFAHFGDYRVIPNATGFGLYDREVIDCLQRWRDPEPFFRGMLVESGYSLETIPYHRPQRAGGATKNNWATILSFGLSGLASSSRNLLRAPLVISLVVFMAAALAVVAAIVAVVLGGSGVFPFLLALALFMSGLMLFFIGLIGEQVRLIAQMVRNEPLVVEKERVNFPRRAA